MIAIIDYNAGNVGSMANALKRLKVDFVITQNPKIILEADKVIFPGQGRAGSAMKNLRVLGLDKVIKKITAPFLGICLGMQLLLSYSEEDSTDCLSIIPGRVKKFTGKKINIPQMGWNTVSQARYSELCRDLSDTFFAYLANSYYISPKNKYTVGRSQYGNTPFASIIKKDNFYGTQFHPEKSGDVGLQLLKNFCQLGTPQKNKTVIIPAIDLISGKCVRLRQGDYSNQKTYSANPLTVAQSFANAGAQYLHLIDLDGARLGQPRNQKIIIKIAQSVSVPVQVGGGIRTYERAMNYLDNGVTRVILGSSALTNKKMLQKLIANYGPGRMVVSVDARDGLVAAKGWKKTTKKSVPEFLRELATLGVTTIIYTDIKRDGTLTGPNYQIIKQVLAEPFKVIIAGGVTTARDAQKLNKLGANGVIVGKALYEKKFDLKQALQLVPAPKSSSCLPAPSTAPTKRIIACMDVANGRVVKGTHFKNLRDAGDPVKLGKFYSDNGIDELVFLDINATVENRSTLYDLIKKIACKINIPFTVGGGVKTIADIKNLLNAGADKVSIGSAAVTNPSIVSQATNEFGSQCIVISVDAKRCGKKWEIYIKGGREATGLDAIAFCRDMERRGAGELLVNSLDRDGTKQGYDLALLRAVGKNVSLPVIASSGAGNKEHFREAFTIGCADAALAATLFHYGKLGVRELKNYLKNKQIPVRL